ncbi:MAG: glycosyltransferase family 39 protein [Candidatus Omnitrophota bacterium]
MSKTKILIFFLILLLSFLIRIPQLNFPSIGYHNMKENEYISMARNMLNKKDLANREVDFYHAFDTKAGFELYPQAPFIAYQVLLGYKLFGNNLWFPRLINIIYMLFSIVCIFYLVQILTGEYFFGIGASFLLAVMPLGVYFARNLQPESGAFLFMLIGNLMWFNFISRFRRGYLLGFAVSLVMTAAYKMSFLIGFIALPFLLAYRSYFSERKIKGLIADLGIVILPCLLFIAYCIATGQTSFSSCENRVNILSVFTPSYWKQNLSVILYYAVRENFTPVYSVLFIIGLLLAWKRYRTDKSLFAKYLRLWSLTVVLYCMVFSDYINQHNYYQFPFLGFFILAVIYALREISVFICSYLKTKKVSYCFAVLFIVIFVFAASSAKQAIANHYNTVFVGTDVAGQLLKERAAKDEKFFIYTIAQGYATCVYAERKCGYPASLEEFKKIESGSHVRFVVFYPISMLNSVDPKMRDYIIKTHHIIMVGFRFEMARIFPEIMILEKGGSVDFAAFIRQNQKRLKLAKVYRTLNRLIPFYIMEENK